jgi:uncharacterized protein YlxW (UPF0749 family)
MNKKNRIITIFGMTFLIGVVLSAQIGAQNSGQRGLVLITQTQMYKEELQKVQEEKESAGKQLLEYESRIDEIEKDEAGKSAYLKSLVEDVDKYKIDAALTDVKGPGIKITIMDPVLLEENLLEKDESIIMSNCDLLISLVNKLKSAGAEAISINGQRILATTEIIFVGDNVNINTVPTAPPYLIKAIGDPDALEYALTIRYGIAELMRQSYSLQVTVEKQEEVTIPRYNRIINFRYAKPAKD